MKIHTIFLLLLFFFACDHTILQPSGFISPSTQESISNNSLSLFLINSAAPSLKIETNHFYNLLSQTFPKNISIYFEEIPPSLSPKDIGKYQELKRKEADVILYVLLSFEEKEDKEYIDSIWLYATVELRLHDPLSEKELGRTHLQTDRGIIAWKGKERAKQIALEELAKKSSKYLYEMLSALPSFPTDRIRLSASFDTQEQMEIFQNELKRLERARHFRIQKDGLIVSAFLGVTLEYQQDLFSLKDLLAQACQSAGIPVRISMTRKTIFVEPKD